MTSRPLRPQPMFLGLIDDAAAYAKITKHETQAM